MTRRRTIRRPIASAAALVAVATTALLAGGPSTASPVSPASPGQVIPIDRPTRVLSVGDSVMEGATTAIPGALAGREVVVDTEVSRSTGNSVDAALGHGTDWDVLVVLLGHNDGGSPGAYQPAFRRLFDAHADTPRIIALTLHQVRPYYADVNNFLRSEAASRSNLVVADWNAVASANPGATAGDGLHLNGTGASLMAGLIAETVEAAETDLAPTTTTMTTTTTTTAPPSTTTTTEPAPTTTVPSPTTTVDRPVVIDASPADVQPEAERLAPTDSPSVNVGALVATVGVLGAAVGTVLRRTDT